MQAPGQKAWENLFKGERVLILLDELPPYFQDALSKSIGNSDLAQVTATALSNLLVALGRESCAQVCLVITDLASAYAKGGARIASVISDFEKETHKAAMTLEPVRLNSDELYHILRTRIFETLPSEEDVSDVAQSYGQAVRAAKQMAITSQSPEEFARQVASAYPFHPGIRDLYARFRENDGFQQTRGLIRLMRIVTARMWSTDTASQSYLIAALLTWGALNIVGGGEQVAKKVKKAQTMIFEAVDRQVTEWGIEHNEKGWRADAYLYCVEVRDPESDWTVPVAPSWVIGEKTRTIGKLVPDEKNRCYIIEIQEGVSDKEMARARNSGTVKDSRLIPPDGSSTTPMDLVRRGLRLWENEDLVPRWDDVFQERLYCIRWVETYYELKEGKKIREFSREDAESLPNFGELLKQGRIKEKTRRHYRAPTPEDLGREKLVFQLLQERFTEWQEKGFIPSRRIEPGAKTAEPIRTRGWTHWHHLFTPRQLLIIGSFGKFGESKYLDNLEKVSILLSFCKVADNNSKLCRWHTRKIGDKSEQTFSNQALNTLYNYASRSLSSLESVLIGGLQGQKLVDEGLALPIDGRNISTECDLWITDPPYADAINYHELSEFFLAWYEKHLPNIFPDWYTDSKRAMAVKGSDASFRQTMVECYRRLVEHMPENGLQVVMFTHQDPAVWADLALILWAAGLRVTSAWCIATETDSALKQGNYVQGTVLMVLRRRTDHEPVFIDEIVDFVEAEVRSQLDVMTALEDASDPNFGDADFQLAAYAAALRILTERPIEEVDPAKEVQRSRKKGEISAVENLIRNAVKIACDHMSPKGIQKEFWKTLSPMERFYLKGLEVETHGEYRSGVYQELARGFGAIDYKILLSSSRANQTRLKTPKELGKRMISGDGFAETLVRQVLFAIHQAQKNDETNTGLSWLRTEISDYWGNREKLIHLLEYFKTLSAPSNMEHWRPDAVAAGLLAGAVRNDHI